MPTYRFVYILHSAQIAIYIFGGGSHGDLWPWNLNSVKIFVQRIYSPGFIILCSVIQKLSCWQTNPQTDATENIHLTLLCYARLKGSWNICRVTWHLPYTYYLSASWFLL